MADKGEDKEVDEMVAEVQRMELQAKNMEKLVAQRRQEREHMEVENSRIKRQLKYLKEMVVENEEVEADHQKQLAAKQPFSGQGFKLGDPTPTASASDTKSSQAPIRKVNPVSVDPNKPSGNIQVRLGDGSRLVLKLNTVHTVAQIKQEIMARNPEESRREFKLVTLGPPSKVLLDHAVIGDENLVGSAVIQRFE